MEAPWELKESDVRTSDTLFTVVIFCEDEVSEDIYFKWFETALMKVNIINNQKSMMHNVINAIAHCKKHGILVKAGEVFALEKGMEVWCVYDRDSGSDPEKNHRDDTEFDESINTANAKGINVAWSNDAFELWVLLHFEDVDPVDIATYGRVFYYDRLTDIFRNFADPNEDLLKVLKYPVHFNYKNSLKRDTNFRNIVRPAILPKTNLAIARAKALEAFHYAKNDCHSKKPCTLTYQLVERLLEIGGKELPVEA